MENNEKNDLKKYFQKILDEKDSNNFRELINKKIDKKIWISILEDSNNMDRLFDIAKENPEFRVISNKLFVILCNGIKANDLSDEKFNFYKNMLDKFFLKMVEEKGFDIQNIVLFENIALNYSYNSVLYDLYEKKGVLSKFEQNLSSIMKGQLDGNSLKEIDRSMQTVYKVLPKGGSKQKLYLESFLKVIEKLDIEQIKSLDVMEIISEDIIDQRLCQDLLNGRKKKLLKIQKMVVPSLIKQKYI